MHLDNEKEAIVLENFVQQAVELSLRKNWPPKKYFVCVYVWER